MYNPPRRFSHQLSETVNIGVSERRKITTKSKHIIPSAIGDKLQMVKPVSVSVSPPDGKIVVADQEICELIFFDKKYKFVKTVGGPGHGDGEYHVIKAVSVGVNGDIVVADSGNNRIQVLTPSGDFTRVFGSVGKSVGQFDDITDVIVDSQDRIYVCDAGNSRIQILDLYGNFIREFGSCGNKISDIIHPQSVAVCPCTGNVILADTSNRRVQVFYATGQHRFTIGWTGAEECELLEPTSVAIGPKWTILVADPTQGRICGFTMDGTLVQEYGHHGMLDNGEQFEPRQLAINSENGDVIVIDGLNKRVIVFNG